MKRSSQSALPLPGQNIPGDTDILTIPQFQTLVLDHYRQYGRDLPWRRTTDPYHILVSEIMLQQTQVERVTAKYPAFLAAFPDFGSLAYSPLPEVLSLWQGMGYNRRAIALQQCARRVVDEFGGSLPEDPAVLATFPGIGKATAASICAFAFNAPVIFIETNIRRVFIHHFFPGRETVADDEILPLVELALYRNDPRTWYNALMDLGTDLKARVPNPNRRSRHYTRQAAFEGSDRKIRGSILRILLDEKTTARENLSARIAEDPDRVARILADLEREGFLSITGTMVSIAPVVPEKPRA